MHRSTLTSRFLAGWEPAVLPARGPDGMIPSGPPPKLQVIQPPPSLCEAGPCRHFHRVVSSMDAQWPLDGSAGPHHAQATRACYPAVGIELDLGETPVQQCSRWEPDSEQERLNALRDTFLKSPAGKVFAQQVDDFENAVREAREKRDAGGDDLDSDRLQAEADMLARTAGAPSDDVLDVLEDEAVSL